MTAPPSEHPATPYDTHGNRGNCRDSRLQRMDNSSRYRQMWPALLVAFAFLVISSVLTTVTEGAPLASTDSIPTPPLETNALNDAFFRITYPEPTGHHISFYKNHQCTLHQRSEGTPKKKSIICGLRELDLPEGAGSGVKFWTPRKCQRYHCQCLATRDINRPKRTISDNKTDIVYKRFRVFECV